MLSFAVEEGLADETAEEIYRLWVERKMEGAIDSYDIVQSHLRDVPLKVRVHLPGGSLSEAQPFCTALTAAGVRRSSFAFAPTAWSCFAAFRHTAVLCRRFRTMQ